MATATLSYTGPADGQTSVTFTHVGTVPDAMAPSFFAAYRETYGNYWDAVNGMVTQQANQPGPPNGTGAANAVATDAQIFDAYAVGIAAGTAANTTRYLQEQAKAAALAQVNAAIVTQQS